MKFLHVDSIIYATVALFGFFFITLPSPADALETLSLADCISSAKVNNKALKTAAWDIQKGSETIRQKDSSNYPRIDAQVGYTMQLEPQAVIISGRVAETQEPDYLFGGVAATYTLYDFGRRAATLEQAKLANAVTSNSFQALTVNVTLQVIELYFGILELEKLIDTTVQESNQLEQHHNIAQALYDEGVVTRNDILQADVRLAGVKQKLLSLRNSRGNRWLQLNHLTGKPSSYRAELDSKTAISVYESQAINEETAFIRRGEIMALRRSSELADSAVTESRSNFFPELYSRFAVDYVQNDKVREQAVMSASIGIKVNIFDGFASTAIKNRAVLERSKSREALAEAESQVRLEISMAKNDRLVAAERIAVAETSIKQSRENLRINQERYKERVGTATEVLDAQTMLSQSQTEYFRAIFDQQIANARYQKAIGKL